MHFAIPVFRAVQETVGNSNPSATSFLEEFRVASLGLLTNNACFYKQSLSWTPRAIHGHQSLDSTEWKTVVQLLHCG